MTVKELIEALSELEPDRLVVLSADAEGNSYSPAYALWEGAYEAESDWYGQVGLEELTDEDVEDGFTEDDVIEGVPAVVIVPSN